MVKALPNPIKHASPSQIGRDATNLNETEGFLDRGDT